MLQWLRAIGCPWDEKTCREAAHVGYLEILKWARANGCLWSALPCYWAAQNEHLDVVKWLQEKNFLWDVNGQPIGGTAP